MSLIFYFITENKFLFKSLYGMCKLITSLLLPILETLQLTLHQSFSLTELSILLSNIIIQTRKIKGKLRKMSLFRHDTIKDILPTMKRFLTEQEEFSYAQGKTYRKHGLLLKHTITNMKIKSLVSTFARKIKRNVVNSEPAMFELRHPDRQEDERTCKWTGWKIEDRIEGFLMFLDIIMSVITFFLSAFQGFLYDFRNSIDNTSAVPILKIISITIFVVRLVLVMITVDYENDTLYLYITDIIRKEFKGGDILLHIFSLVMVFISLAHPSDEAVGIVFFFSSFLKLALIRSNIKILELRFVDSIKKFYIWNLIRIIIFDIIFAHIISTALLAAASFNPDANWVTIKLVNNGFVDQGQTWFKVYIWSYYWACTIMMTIGFGDISPVDYRESIVVAFIEIFSSIVLAYNISEVGNIVSSMRKSSQELQRKLGVLRRMSIKEPIPEELQCKIESYLTHQTQIRDKFQYNQHRDIINHLPEQLKQQYFYQCNQSLYNDIPLFRYFKKECLAKLNRAFSGKVYYPGEYIIKFRKGNNKVIIMKSGQFGLAYWKPRSSMNGTVVQSITLEGGLRKGALVTTNILSRDSQLKYDVLSITYSYGMQMSLESFLQILKQSNLDYYYYRSVLDRHEKEGNPYDYAECEYCPNEYHTKFDCVRLHYIPIRSERFLRNQTAGSKPVQRSQSFRKSHAFIRHSYLIRSRLSGMEKEMKMSIEGDAGLLEVDSPSDFSMYFREFNPENLRNRRNMGNRQRRTAARSLHTQISLRDQI